MSDVAGTGRRVGRWVALCAAAEAVGMTAAAAAATAAAGLADRPAALAWGVVVAGGLVEGTALGVAQGAAIATDAPTVPRRRWLLVTVLVAGLGWAAASAPAVLAADDGGSAAPPVLVMLAAAAALGVGMGALLGAVQAWVLRGAVARPWRWVGVSAAAWTPAMVVIFAGATWTPAGWPVLAVVGVGTVTGLVAGAVLGAVCGGLVPLLHGDRAAAPLSPWPAPPGRRRRPAPRAARPAPPSRGAAR